MTYSPRKAWIRATVYFVACWVIAWASGALGAILNRPIFSQSTGSHLLWIILTIICTAVIVVGYGVIWPKGTLTHGRPLSWSAVLLFGLLWGLSEGLLFVSVWWLVGRFVENGWLVGIITFLILSSYKGVWHSQYWDIYVSPEHNIEEWNMPKVLYAHTPNLIVTLTHLTLFSSMGLFILWQTIALMLSAYFMHFPSPFEPETS